MIISVVHKDCEQLNTHMEGQSVSPRVIVHRKVLANVRITVEVDTKTVELKPSPDKKEHQNTHPLPVKSVRKPSDLPLTSRISMRLLYE